MITKNEKETLSPKRLRLKIKYKRGVVKYLTIFIYGVLSYYHKKIDRNHWISRYMYNYLYGETNYYAFTGGFAH